LILVLFVIQQQDGSVNIFAGIANVILTYRPDLNAFWFDKQYKSISCLKIG
jgi:hypothetical protein